MHSAPPCHLSQPGSSCAQQCPERAGACVRPLVAHVEPVQGQQRRGGGQAHMQHAVHIALDGEQHHAGVRGHLQAWGGGVRRLLVVLLLLLTVP